MTRYRCQRSGTPLSSCSPASSKVRPLPDSAIEVRIPRGGWTLATLNDAEPDDRDELGADDQATLRALMSIEDLTQPMIGFLS
jgi:hypothetical protein